MTDWIWGWRRRILCLLGFHEDYLFFIHTYDGTDKHRLRRKMIQVCTYCHRVEWADAGTQRKYWLKEE